MSINMFAFIGFTIEDNDEGTFINNKKTKMYRTTIIMMRPLYISHVGNQSKRIRPILTLTSNRGEIISYCTEGHNTQ